MLNIFEELDLEKGQTYENIEIFNDCIIPKGTYLEVYCNPDGIYSDSSNGFSLFIKVDINTTAFTIIDDYDLLQSCQYNKDEVRIDILNLEDYPDLKESDFFSFNEYLNK